MPRARRPREPEPPPPPATIDEFFACLQEGEGLVRVPAPAEDVRAAWRRIIHAVRTSGRVPEGWHLLHRGRNSGDLVVELRRGQHPYAEYMRQLTRQVPVPELLTGLHPLVESLRGQRDRLPESAENQSRALMVVESLVRGAERRELGVRGATGRTLVEVIAGGMPYGVQVSEQRAKRLTRLAVTITGQGFDGRPGWTDGPDRPVEETVEEILAEILRRAEWVRQQRAEQERQAAEHRAREQAAAVRAHCVEELREQVEAWLEAAAIRRHCDELVAAGMDPEDAWIRWALAQAEDLDPLNDPPGMPGPPPDRPAVRYQPGSPVASRVVDERPWHPNRRWYHR
nr:hypothetical protein asmbl_3 [uncultured bacterium]